MATLASSGCSVGEVVALQAAQISNSLPLYIAIPQGKLLLARRAPLSREAHTRITDWLAQRPVHSDYVFTRFDGRGLQARASAEPLSRTSVWRLVQRYGRQVGLAGVKPQDAAGAGAQADRDDGAAVRGGGAGGWDDGQALLMRSDVNIISGLQEYAISGIFSHAHFSSTQTAFLDEFDAR